MELVRKEVIPYQWNALNDKVEGAEPSFCMRNFRIAAGITAKRKDPPYKEKIWPTDVFQPLPEDPDHLEERFYGFLFLDSAYFGASVRLCSCGKRRFYGFAANSAVYFENCESADCRFNIYDIVLEDQKFAGLGNHTWVK